MLGVRGVHLLGLVAVVVQLLNAGAVWAQDTGCPETAKEWTAPSVTGDEPFDIMTLTRNGGIVKMTFKAEADTEAVLGAEELLSIHKDYLHCEWEGTSYCIEVFTGRTPDAGNPEMFSGMQIGWYFGAPMAMVVTPLPDAEPANTQIYKMKETLNGEVTRDDHTWVLDVDPENLGSSNPEVKVPGIPRTVNNAAVLWDFPGNPFSPLVVGSPVGVYTRENTFETFILVGGKAIAVVQWGFTMTISAPPGGVPTMTRFVPQVPFIICRDRRDLFQMRGGWLQGAIARYEADQKKK